MKKKFIFICFVTLSVAHASFFGSLFGKEHKSKHRSDNIDYKKESDLYKQLCKTESTAYGFKIKCIPNNETTNFKADASATVKCIQMVNGTGNYPSQVNLSKEYIKSLNLCQQSEIYGPNTLRKSNVVASGAIYISNHSSVTYYDIVCNNQTGFESTVYAQQEKAYTEQSSKAISQCQELNAPEPKKFIIMFYICIGLAIIALGIFIYNKFKKPLD